LSETTEADAVLFCGEESRGADGASGVKQAVEVVGDIAVVVREGDAAGEMKAGGLDAREELRRAGDAAEGDDRAVDGRDLHGAAKTPDGALPAESFQFRFEGRVFSGNGENAGAECRAERLAEVAGGKQAIGQVLAIKQENVEVAGELTVLEAVVEKMQTCHRG